MLIEAAINTLGLFIGQEIDATQRIGALDDLCPFVRFLGDLDPNREFLEESLRLDPL